MGQSAEQQMQNTLFQLKFTAKNLVRESQKCTKREKVQKKKLKKVCLDCVRFARHGQNNKGMLLRKYDNLNSWLIVRFL